MTKCYKCKKKMKISCEVFVNRNVNVVPLHHQSNDTTPKVAMHNLANWAEQLGEIKH